MNILQLFNPGNQTEQDIAKNFSIRLKEFERICNIIKHDNMKNAPQHFIIQGLRGSGKTTLLFRVYYELKGEKKLNSWLIPIIFNEEQYSVNKLFKLWEQIAVELESESVEYCELMDEMQESDGMDSYEEHCYELLFSALKRHKHKICVLIDNIGDFLKKLSKQEQQRLREVLITNNQLRIVGASSEVLESTYKYDEPFYEFFKIIYLRELKSKETRAFLLNLDRINGKDKIRKIIEESPGRIEALRIITGGVPRTIVLLYEIFINDQNGDSFKHLELLLDRVTPLYKHRMDDLSTQQQEIIDCIALNWDAIAVKEIARKTRMESKAISAQLRLLEKNNLVIKKQTSTKNHLYQVKERFFNIWYIMRNGRKADKNKVKWLTKFLEIWCDTDSLNDMINQHIAKLKAGNMYDKYAYSLSEAYAPLVSSPEKQHQLLSETNAYLKSINSSLVHEQSQSDVELIKDEIKPLIDNEEYEKAIHILKSHDTNTGLLESLIALVYNVIKDNVKAEQYFLMAVEKGHEESVYNLALLYDYELKDFKKAEKYYLMAIEKGDEDALNNLADLYYKEFKDFIKAEKYYLLAVKKGNENAIYNLACLYGNELKDYNKAEHYYLLAAEKGDEEGMFNLAILYQQEFKDVDKAENYYLLAIEKGYEKAMINLALIYFEKGLNKEKAKQLTEQAFIITEKCNTNRLNYSFMLLWNNKTDIAFEISAPLFQDKTMFEERIDAIELLINMLIAKKQYHFVYQLFEENRFQIKDRIKPIYYALMHFMQDQYPDEILKMGEELQETVDSIVQFILELRKKYK